MLWRVIDNLFIYFDRVCKREALHCRICSTFCNDICLGVWIVLVGVVRLQRHFWRPNVNVCGLCHQRLQVLRVQFVPDRWCSIFRGSIKDVLWWFVARMIPLLAMYLVCILPAHLAPPRRCPSRGDGWGLWPAAVLILWGSFRTKWLILWGQVLNGW